MVLGIEGVPCCQVFNPTSEQVNEGQPCLDREAAGREASLTISSGGAVCEEVDGELHK